MEYLENSKEKFDVIFASGVLYHMSEPAKLLKLVSEKTDKVFLWTHYFDKGMFQNRKRLKRHFSFINTSKFDGIEYEFVIQSYKSSLYHKEFCGGSKTTSKWLTRESLFNLLTNYGFKNIKINFDDLNHPNGPAVAICAQKV